MIALMTPPAIVQSFDCQKAATKIEKMICADPELATLDREMARVFAEARQRAGGAVPGQQGAPASSPMLAPAAVGCKPMLDGVVVPLGFEQAELNYAARFLRVRSNESQATA